MSTLFTPDYRALDEIFIDKADYLIPSYQRPYSWDCLGRSDKNNQVNVMWDDLIDYFESGSKDPYFMGSMVMIQRDERSYEVIDGQQRLTTILLLFAAAKCVLKDKSIKLEENGGVSQQEIDIYLRDNIEELERLIFNRTSNIGQFVSEKKVRIQRGIGFDFDQVLKVALSCESENSILVPNQTSDEERAIIRRYFNNLDFFVQKIKGYFTPNLKYTAENLTRLSSFLAFLRFRIGIIRIIASSFNAAYQIFEILNNRGLPLSNIDLLRNFMIKEFALLNESQPGRCPDPTAKWHALEMDNELDNAFISRYVESINAKKQRYSAFNDLKEIYDRRYSDKLGKFKIELFYEDLQKELAIYTQIVRYQFASRDLNNRLRFLLLCPNVPSTVNLLMAVCRGVRVESEILAFVKAYEVGVIFSLGFYWWSSKRYFDQISAINTGNIDGVIKDIRSEDELSHSKIKKTFLKFLNGKYWDNGQALILIAKYHWVVDAQKAEQDVARVELDLNQASLEHIIPQNPAKGTNWLADFSEDFRKEYTYKLGNFTLLTTRMNSAAKNYDFSKKQEIYRKTRLPITQEMTVPGFQMTEAYIRDRHNRICKTILQDLGL
jgi:uncharacterized protein with ParB-like and HNH nuclease domain